MRGRLRFLSAILAGLLAISGGAVAAPSFRGEPTDESVGAWRFTHLEIGDYVYSGWAGKSILYFDPWSLERTADGRVSAQVRAEHFQPVRDGANLLRSSGARVDFDCQALKTRTLAFEGFSENNMKGKRYPRDTSAPEWRSEQDEGELLGVLSRQVCSLESLVGSPSWSKAMPRAPEDFSDEGLTAWMVSNVDVRDELFLGVTEGTGLFYSPRDTEKLANGHFRVWLRRELPFPITLQLTSMRSSRTHVELDCARRRFLNVDLIVFPGFGQTGTPSSDFIGGEDTWSLATAGSAAAEWLDVVCRLATDPKVDLETARQPRDTPKPPELSAAGVGEWIDQNLNLNNFVGSTISEEAAYLYGTEDLELLPNGGIAAYVRHEYFEADQYGQRSALLRMEFDCRGRRARFLNGRYYASSNLQALIESVEEPDSYERVAPDTIGAKVLGDVCAQASLLAEDVDRNAAFIPRPDEVDDEGVQRWITEFVELSGYVPSTYTEEGAFFYSSEEAERTRQDHIRVWVREELFEPGNGAIRSMKTLVEFDCAEGRERTLSVETYPGSNLQGRPDVNKGDGAWAFTSPRSASSLISAQLCDLKDAADAEIEDSASRPRLPLRDAKTPL